jgi:hypothetical protein
MQITIQDLRNMTAQQISAWVQLEEETNNIQEQEQQFNLTNKEYKKIEFELNVPELDMSICPDIIAK